MLFVKKSSSYNSLHPVQNSCNRTANALTCDSENALKRAFSGAATRFRRFL